MYLVREVDFAGRVMVRLSHEPGRMFTDGYPRRLDGAVRVPFEVGDLSLGQVIERMELGYGITVRRDQ